MFENIKKDTICGLVSGVFDNDNEIKEKLNAQSMPKFFEELKRRVECYYGKSC